MKIPAIQTLEVLVKSPSLEGLKILHLSDLHINKKTSLKSIQALVDECSCIAYDFIALTGDIIDCKVQFIQAQLEILNQLQDVFYISGNHDLVYGLNGLKHCLNNFTFLDNRNTFIHFKNHPIAIAGLSDRFSRFFRIKREEQKIVKFLQDNPNGILLAHQPKDYKIALQAKAALFLCGHTHGGQIYPFGYFVRIFQPFLQGLHYKNQTAIYVNKGLGNWGVDFRYKADNEITLLKLTQKSVKCSKGVQ